MMLNFAAYVFAFLAYYAVGFAFQFGGVAINAAPAEHRRHADAQPLPARQRPVGIPGRQGLLPERARPTTPAATCLMLFEVVFMETAGYIIVGAICERITFGAFLLCELFVGAILYPIFGCWVWGGGWMSQLGTTMGLGHGYVDFAGSTVVHAVGGFCAMALAVILGPRLGKYGPDGKPRAFPAHNLVFVVTGTFILLFGWMGFNPGSTLGATDLRISVVAINTNLAAVAGSATAMLFWYLHVRQAGHHDGLQRHAGRPGGDHRALRVRQPDFGIVIGILAGVLVCFGVLFNERVLKVDDPCGAISVHGFCGWLGAVSVGIFADGTYGAGWNGVGAATYLGKAGRGVTGLLHGDTSQFLVQLGGATLCAVWAFGATFVVFKIVNAIKRCASRRKSSWKVWTCRSSAAWRIRKTPSRRWSSALPPTTKAMSARLRFIVAAGLFSGAAFLAGTRLVRRAGAVAASVDWPRGGRHRHRRLVDGPGRPRGGGAARTRARPHRCCAGAGGC